MIRQKFKGEVLTRTKTVNNILRTFNDPRVDAQGGWYVEANEYARELARQFNVTILQAAGVIASLSPLKQWTENKRIAKTFLRNGNAYHTGAMKAKAAEILDNCEADADFIQNVLNGNKIKSFFLNIAYPERSDAVTIDRHALCVALGRTLNESELKDITSNQYEFFQQCYRIAADKAGILPHEMQAITWIKWRELKKIDRYAEVPF